MKKSQSPEELIAFLETRWPGRRSKEIRQAFMKLKGVLKQASQQTPRSSGMLMSRSKPHAEPHRKSFNMLDVVRRICARHDFLFLSRQLTYHIAAPADLPEALGNEGEVSAIVSELIGYIARRAPRGGRIDIEIKEGRKQQRPAVEIVFKSMDLEIANLNRATYLKQLFEQEGEVFASPIFACKEALVKEGGQLFVEVPEPTQTVFRILLPTIQATSIVAGDHKIFKYDIAIKNIANVRKRFGIRKSESLVSQIEEFVRSLVRHPIDIVTAVHDKGTITTIYEIEKGAAQSIASRISARLGSEQFQIGKKAVDLNFSYNLSALPSAPLQHHVEAKQMNR